MTDKDLTKMVHTHKGFYDWCPLCKLNKLYIQVITRIGVTQEEQNKATDAYRARDLEALQAMQTE